MRAGLRMPIPRRAHRHAATVGRPIGVRIGVEHPIGHVHRRHLHHRRPSRQIPRPPKSLAQPLAHRRHRLIARNHKRHHAVGRNLLGVGLLIQFFRSAKRAAQRLRAGVVAHRRPATAASEVVRGLMCRGRFFIGSLLRVVGRCDRRFGAAVGAEHILFVQHRAANRAFRQQIAHV